MSQLYVVAQVRGATVQGGVSNGHVRHGRVRHKNLSRDELGVSKAYLETLHMENWKFPLSDKEAFQSDSLLGIEGPPEATKFTPYCMTAR